MCLLTKYMYTYLAIPKITEMQCSEAIPLLDEALAQ